MINHHYICALYILGPLQKSLSVYFLYGELDGWGGGGWDKCACRFEGACLEIPASVSTRHPDEQHVIWRGGGGVRHIHFPPPLKPVHKGDVCWAGVGTINKLPLLSTRSIFFLLRMHTDEWSAKRRGRGVTPSPPRAIARQICAFLSDQRAPGYPPGNGLIDLRVER